MPTTQAKRIFTLTVEGLGPDALLCSAFQGREAISELFHFAIDCFTETSKQVKLSDLLGKRATLDILLADGSKRHVCGIISRASFVGLDMASEGRFSRYRIEVVPWLWLLDRSKNCRIFQDKTAPEIISAVFQGLGFSDFKLSLTGKYRPIDYCVQYRETDFQFVSRLMEEEGIFYFFKHTAGSHVLMLGDSPQAHEACPGHDKVLFEPEAGFGDREDCLTNWQDLRSLRAGKVMTRAHNFQLPSKTLEVSVPSKISAGNNSKYVLYDYPGDYAHRFTAPDARLDQVEQEGDRLARLRMELEESHHHLSLGNSYCRGFHPGTFFEIDKPPAGVEPGPYLLTAVEHTGSAGSYVSDSGDDRYSNCFQCIPHAVPFRPSIVSQRPVVHGSQTATVVGPAGEEIYTDKFGRVKVQFPWDREGKNDENSSCWIRCAQIHAGKGFGGIDIPRIGDEVVVSFMEGDPDQPLITGRVYHAENMPPFGLPDKKVISGIKTKTYKGDGYNELVMDDSPGNELIRVHGQYDMDSTIEHDLREHVLNDRSRDVTNNETILIGNDRTETVNGNESLTVAKNKTINIGINHTETIGSNMTVSVGNNLTETVALNYAETVGVAMQLTVGAAMTQTVGGVYSLTVGAAVTQTMGSSLTTKISSDRKEQVGGKVTEKVGGDVTQQFGGKHSEKVKTTYKLKAGGAITIDSDASILLKTGAASIKLESNGTITIKGTSIKVEGSAKITEKAPMISAEASGKHDIKGAMVTVDASAINTIKGSLVKIN